MSVVDFQQEMRAENEAADQRMSIVAWLVAVAVAGFFLAAGWATLVLLRGFQA